MKKFIWFLMAAAVISFTACDEDTGDTGEETNVDTTATIGQEMSEDNLIENGFRFYPMEGFQQFQNVQLSLTGPQRGAAIQPGNVRFTYNVKNFELGKKTDDADRVGIANSADGQHLHVILNNEPYMAHYKPEFQK